MATNKKKDAAALFELLDKSTLKVPKGGALKIPSWYSSKTNPPTQAAPGATGIRVGGTAGAATPAQADEEMDDLPAPFGVAATQAAAPAPVAPSTPVAPAAVTPAPKPITSLMPSATANRTPMTPIPPQKQVFAPVAPGSGGQSILANRNVIWLSIVCGVVAVALLIVVLSRLSHKTTPTATNGQSNNSPTLSAGGSSGPGATGGTVVTVPPPETLNGTVGVVIVPPQGQNTGGTVPPPNGNATNPPNNNGGIVNRRGTIEESKKIDWSKEPKGVQYLVIASYSTKRAEYAQKAADFLADHGVDVVLLTNATNDSIRLFMRQGFSSNTEAQAAIVRIQKIGEDHPEAKKTGKTVFPGPYLATISFAPKN